MAKTIQVIVDVQSDSVKFATDQTMTLTQQVKLLYKELQKVPEGTKEWSTLQKAYNDTKDNLDRVNVKSKELFGTLSTLPGPVGDFSAKLQGGIDLLKTFSSFTLKDLGAAFKGVIGDVGDVFNNLSGGKKVLQETTESTEDLSKETKLYSDAISNTAGNVNLSNKVEKEAIATRATLMTASKEYTLYVNGKMVPTTQQAAAAAKAAAVAETEAAVATNLWAASIKGLLAATGIGLLIVLLTSVVLKLMDYFSATKKSEEATLSFNEAIKEQERLLQNDITALDQAGKAAALRAKLAGKSEKEIFEISQKFGKERVDLLKEYDADLYKAKLLIQKDTKLTEEDRVKLIAETDAKILKSGQDITKQIMDNDIAQLQFKVKVYEDNKKAGLDFSKSELDRLKKELEDKKAQYKEDYAAFAGALKARKEITDANFVEQRYDLAKERFENGMSEEDYNTMLYVLTVKRNEDIAREDKSFLDGRVAFLKEGLDKKLITQKEYDQYLIEAQREYNSSNFALTAEGYNNEIKLLDEYRSKQQEYRDQAIEINNQIKDSWYSLGSSVASSISGLLNVFEQGSDLQKAFAIVSVLINAASAIGKIQLSAQEANADFAKTIATGTATVASGIALASNPITALIGAAQIAAGKTAIATGTAGIAAVKANATRQTIGVGLTSAVQVAAILSAKKSGGATAAGSGGAGGQQAATPTFNGTVNVPAPVIGASQASTTGGLGQTIAGAINNNNSTSRPIQAYVVGDQITAQQQLDRRISLAARMGG
jgi:hypothetical protein